MRKLNQIYVRKINGKKFRVQTLACSENWTAHSNYASIKEEIKILGEVPRYYYLDGSVCKPSNRGFCCLPSKKVLNGIVDGDIKLGDSIVVPKNGPHGCVYTVGEILKEADGKRKKILALFNDEAPF